MEFLERYTKRKRRCGERAREWGEDERREEKSESEEKVREGESERSEKAREGRRRETQIDKESDIEPRGTERQTIDTVEMVMIGRLER